MQTAPVLHQHCQKPAASQHSHKAVDVQQCVSLPDKQHRQHKQANPRKRRLRQGQLPEKGHSRGNHQHLIGKEQPPLAENRLTVQKIPELLEEILKQGHGRRVGLIVDAGGGIGGEIVQNHHFSHAQLPVGKIVPARGQHSVVSQHQQGKYPAENGECRGNHALYQPFSLILHQTPKAVSPKAGRRNQDGIHARAENAHRAEQEQQEDNAHAGDGQNLLKFPSEPGRGKHAAGQQHRKEKADIKHRSFLRFVYRSALMGLWRKSS